MEITKFNPAFLVQMADLRPDYLPPRANGKQTFPSGLPDSPA